MIQKLHYASIGAATLALLLPFVLAGHWLFSLAIALGGLFWWYGSTRRFPGLSSVFLVAVAAFCVLGVWIDLPALYFLAAMLAGLTAWDLDRFAQRLDGVDRVEAEPVVVRKHLLRLGLVDGLGLIVGGAALLLRTTLSFGWVLLLALVTVIGLTQVYNRFKKEINKQ